MSARSFLAGALVAASAFASTASSASAQSTSAAPAEAKAIMTVVTRLFDGMRRGDSGMVRSVFDPRVRLITVASRDGARRVTIENGADNFAKAVGTPRADVWDERIANEHVHVDGDLASVWVDYGFFVGDQFSHCGVDHFLLTRNDAGAWLVLELADTRRMTGCEQWRKPQGTARGARGRDMRDSAAARDGPIE